MNEKELRRIKALEELKATWPWADPIPAMIIGTRTFVRLL